MRTLKLLSKHLDSIRNEWEHKFVEGLIIEMEEGRNFKEKPLSDNQFSILIRIQERFA